MVSETQPPRKEHGSSVQRIDLFGDIAAGPGESTHAAPPKPLPAIDNDKTVISNRLPMPEAVPGVPRSHTLGEMLVGKSLDHYQLVEFVGGGGMGAVFRALDTRLGRTVAVKVLSRDNTDEETIRRFQNEAQSAARLDHPNIARVYFVGEASGWYYIVFEFISGMNLREIVLQNGPLSVEDALRYTLKIAAALDHAAKREVVHRDIKPSNILITHEGEVKLVDMGLARLHQVESSAEDLTASGVTLGTFDYISPEQARDPRLADVRSDIYSLGCTLYFLLTGQPPFPEGTALQKLLRHNGDDAPDLREFRSDLSDRLVRMTFRMLAKKPIQRFQTAGELSAEITAVAAEMGITGLDSTVIDTAAIHRGRSRWWESAVVGVPLVLLFALVLFSDFVSARTSPVVDRPLAPRFKDGQQPLQTLVSPASAIEELRSPPTDTTFEKKISPTPKDPTGSPSETVRPSVEPQKSATPNPLSEGTVPPLDNSSAPTTERVTPGTAGTTAVSAPSDVGNSEATVSPRRSLTKVIVRPGENRPEAGVVSHVGTAVRLAQERGISEIELQFQGPQVERPFEVSSQLLTIRAGDGFRPVILFQPTSGGLQDDQRMIRVIGGGLARMTWRGIEFRLELPPETSSYGWSLFGLLQVHTVALEDCIVTIKNIGQGGSPLHFSTAVFDILPPRMTDTMMDASRPAMSPATALSLTRSIVRGETALIQMAEETPCELNWRQGMLAISDAVLRSTGTTSKPKWYGQLEWRWERVSVYARHGWYQLQRRDDASFQFDLDVRCDHCQLLWGKDAALFDYQNGPSLDEVRLQFDGLDNAYASEEQVFVRVRPKGETKLDFDLRQRQEWTNERRAHYDLAWNEDKANEQPLHTWGRERFPHDSDPNVAGSDPSQLPTPYVAVPTDLPKE